MAKGIKKAPGFYKKALTGTRIEDRYIRYIEQPVDKAFIRSCYEKQDNPSPTEEKQGGAFRLKTGFNETEVKRLKILEKAIKKNRKGAVNVLPLAVVGGAAAAVAVFVFFFMNPLLEKALETGLEAVFEARAEAVNFKLDLWRFEIAMDGLTIADRDSPMQNLIQFSRMGVSLKPQALMRGNVYIEEIRADSIRFGTPRAVSGALPEKSPKPKKEKETADIPPLVDLGNFDAVGLLNNEYDKLQTPKLYDEARAAYDNSAAQWKAEVDAAGERIGQLRAQAEPLLAFRPDNIRTVDRETIDRIQTLAAEITTLVNTVQDARNDVNRIVSGIESDLAAAVKLKNDAANAFGMDFAYLKSYLDFSSGSAMEVIEPVIRDILTDSAEQYLAYGERALEALEKVKEIQAKLPESSRASTEKKEKFKGRDVVFPTQSYPRFFLGELATDVLTPTDWHWSFDLKGVSSDPDLSNVPTSLVLSLAEAGGGLHRTGAFSGVADFRSQAARRFIADVQGSGFPVDIGGSLTQAGIGGFRGNASFTFELAGMSDGSFTGTGGISVADANLLDPSNTLARAVGEAVAEVPSLDLGLAYEHYASASDQFSMTTNIGAIVKEALEKLAGQYIARAEAELERVLREKIASYVDGKFVNSEELDLLFAAAKGDRAAVDALRGELDKKRTELEQKLRTAAEDAAKQAVEEAKRQGEQAVQDLLQGKTPTIEAPSLPIPTLPSNPFRR